MKTGRLKSPLPPLKTRVREVMKAKHVTVNQLSKMMHVTQPTASYMLNRDDWYVSEIMLAGDLLGANFFEVFTPKLKEENAQMQTRIKELEDEMKLVKHENALLKEIMGRKG